MEKKNKRKTKQEKRKVPEKPKAFLVL